MICLFNQYNQDSRDLHESLKAIGVTCPVIVLQEDGFLPEGVTSPFGEYVQMKEQSGKPLYYNQLPVREYWEIEGNNQEAKVLDYGQVRAVIRYAQPIHQRLIQTVEWLDTAGRVRSIDRYNQYGKRFAQTIVDTQGQWINTAYYTQDTVEVLVENHQTGAITYNDQMCVRVFQNRIEFVQYYLKESGHQTNRIIYNTLAEPFLVVYHSQEAGEDVLVWQEPIGEEIPGNMQMILRGETARPTKVLVQSKQAYTKLMALVSEASQKQLIEYVGTIYPIKAKRTFEKNILIYTNSDQIEQVDALIEGLPMYQFHIAALTEMSPKLMNLQRYAHVHLYPNVTMETVARLNQTCDIYLDINHYDEILGAVRAAFEHYQLILGFTNTLHKREYVFDSLIYEPDKVADMVHVLTQIELNQEFRSVLLAKQYDVSDHQTIAHYQAIWERVNG